MYTLSIVMPSDGNFKEVLKESLEYFHHTKDVKGILQLFYEVDDEDRNSYLKLKDGLVKLLEEKKYPFLISKECHGYDVVFVLSTKSKEGKCSTKLVE